MQSSKNWVSWLLVGVDSRALYGSYWATVFSRSGISPSLMSFVPLHRVSTWTMSSIGGEAGGLGPDNPLQITQYGSVPLSCAR